MEIYTFFAVVYYVCFRCCWDDDLCS